MPHGNLHEPDRLRADRGLDEWTSGLEGAHEGGRCADGLGDGEHAQIIASPRPCPVPSSGGPGSACAVVDRRGALCSRLCRRRRAELHAVRRAERKRQQRRHRGCALCHRQAADRRAGRGPNRMPGLRSDVRRLHAARRRLPRRRRRARDDHLEQPGRPGDHQHAHRHGVRRRLADLHASHPGLRCAVEQRRSESDDQLRTHVLDL